jgi:hypothetical protein
LKYILREEDFSIEVLREEDLGVEVGIRRRHHASLP